MKHLPDLPSATIPDFSREVPRGFWDPGRKLLKSIRDYQSAAGVFAAFSKGWAILRHRFWSSVTSCDIPINTQIGGGLLIPHPIGIVIHQRSIIGPNCLLMQNTTLGQKGMGESGTPVLVGGVDLSVGAVVLGDVRIGEHGLVAANAVVTKDVDPGAVVAGVPAKVIGSR